MHGEFLTVTRWEAINSNFPDNFIWFPVKSLKFPVPVSARNSGNSLIHGHMRGILPVDEPKNVKIPCIFPVKQGIGQRRVRSRLPPPPYSHHEPSLCHALCPVLRKKWIPCRLNGLGGGLVGTSHGVTHNRILYF